MGFVSALELLGIRLSWGNCERAKGVGDCFATRSAADVLTASGEKLIGSAQRRKDGAILMQSSIRHFRPAIDPLCVFVGEVSEAGYPLSDVTNVDLESALASGFQSALNVEPARGELSVFEVQNAERKANALKAGIRA